MCDAVNLDYLENHFDRLTGVKSALEVGSYNVNGNSKELLASRGIAYTGIDLQEGPDVDLVCDITDEQAVTATLGDRRFDLVVCANVLEHVYEPVRALDNILRLLEPGGFLLLITPLVWDLHDWPHDYYRLNPDFYKRYAKDNGLEILPDTFLLSVRDTGKFYDSVEKIPRVIPHLYRYGVQRLLIGLLSKLCPELKHCYSLTYLNLICRKRA